MACHETPFRPTRGFTLIELVVALVVAAIVITVAVPVSNNIIERNMMTAARDRLIGALSFARSEAVKQNRTVTLCNSVDGKAPCRPMQTIQNHPGRRRSGCQRHDNPRISR